MITVVLRALALAALAVALVPAFAGMTGPALAHAVLVSSDPVDGAVLARAPALATLVFNEPVEPVHMRVVERRSGALVATLAPRADGAGRVTATLPALADGGWLLSWRVISGDSHPVGGSIAFDVGAADPTASRAPEVRAEADLTRLAGAARAIVLVLLLGAAGGALALAAFAPLLGAPETRSARRVVGLLASACALAALAFVPIQSAAVAGAADGALRPAAWLATPLGRAALAAAGLSAALALLLRRAVIDAPGRIALAILGAAALATLATAGHAPQAPPRAVATLLVATHGLAAGVWLGGLVVLVAAARSACNADLARLLCAFSRCAVPAVALLLAAGVGIAALQTRDPAALAGATWGGLLLVKITLVAIALAFAAQNRWRLTGAVARAEPEARRRLTRNVALEIALLAGVLGLTAALGQVPPPRALAAARAETPAPVVLTAHDHRHRTATLTLAPRPDGRLALTVSLTDPAGRPVPLREAVLQASLPEAGIEAVTRPMRVEDGAARLETGDLAAPGLWRLDVGLLVDDFDAARVGFDMPRP